MFNVVTTIFKITQCVLLDFFYEIKWTMT